MTGKLSLGNQSFNTLACGGCLGSREFIVRGCVNKRTHVQSGDSELPGSRGKSPFPRLKGREGANGVVWTGTQAWKVEKGASVWSSRHREHCMEAVSL